MNFFPAGILVLVISSCLFILNTRALYLWLMLLLPCSMFAVMEFGGLSIVASRAILILLTLKVFIEFCLSSKSKPFCVSSVTVKYALFIAYATFSLLFVFYFSGKIYVVSLSETLSGLAVSPLFKSTISLLKFGSSNVSQLIYMYLAFFGFLIHRYFIRSCGVSFLHKGLVILASVHVLLGILDLIYPEMLNLIRTATYSLLDHHEVAGLKRVVGGTSEASSYGLTAVTLLAYFIYQTIIFGRLADTILSGLLIILTVLTFSSAAYVGLVIILLLLVAGSIFPVKLIPQNKVKYVLVTISLSLVVLVIIGVTSYSLFSEVINKVLLDKSESLSALERGFWAKMGIETFFNTYGLGAGVGSIRSNGFFSSYLGTFGIPGITLFLYLIYSCTLGQLRRYRNNWTSDSYIVIGGMLALLTNFSILAIIQTTTDVGSLFIMLLALSSSLPFTLKRSYAV